MTEQIIGTERPRRTKFAAALHGRYNRKYYWAMLGALCLAGVVIRLMGGHLGYAMSGPMMFVMVRRLHDFNRTGWWALALTLGPVALMLALAPFAPPTTTAPFITLIALVWLVWLGCIPGDPNENRFGPAPGAPDLDEVFS